MSTFTYTFDGLFEEGNIVVQTSDTATNDTGYGLGYDITAISGTFVGKTITGEVGSGGVAASDQVGAHDNTIFTSDGGGFDQSFYGLDQNGFAFSTSDGGEVRIYSAAGYFYASIYDPQSGVSTVGLYLGSSDAPCFALGVQILTSVGEIAVEKLAIGDVVISASAQARPIKWIGERSYSARFARNNQTVWPICFKAGSLGDNQPVRDLWVSPKHAMFLDGVLIEAQNLVNGATIVQPLPTADVRYFHIELESHDVLIADGAAAESFVDDDSRAMFHNAGTFARLYPEASPRAAAFCAPRVEGGEVYERVLQRLTARASSLMLAGKAA